MHCQGVSFPRNLCRVDRGLSNLQNILDSKIFQQSAAEVLVETITEETEKRANCANILAITLGAGANFSCFNFMHSMLI